MIWVRMKILTTKTIHSKIAIIITAAGSSTRIGGGIKKEYLPFKNGTVLSVCAETFLKACSGLELTDFIVTCPTGGIEQCITALGDIAPEVRIAEGSDTRQKSVYNGLLAVTGNPDIVLIHDGARPFVTQEVLDRVREGVLAHGACVCGMPVKDTIRQISSSRKEEDSGLEILGGRPDRSMLRQIQTPQAFDISLVTEAYEAYMNVVRKQEKAGEGECLPAATDDAGVVEMMTDHSVCLAEGSYRNIKLTTPEDMIVGEAFCAQQ